MASVTRTTTESVIETRNLTKQVDRNLVLKDVDLQIPLGSIYGLIGPNGAGKTTLIRLLAMVDQPTLGDVYLNGQQVEYDRPQPHLRRYIGYLPDNYPLYPDLSVGEYLDYFARLYGLTGRQRTRRVGELLELVNLGHKRERLTGTLSRGMKQRLGLARTLIHTPLLLLLDEPVSGLDPIARREFHAIITTLRGSGMTVLITSHILTDLAELCTHVGLMEFGFLLESLPLAEFYQRFGGQRLVVQSLTDLGAIATALRTFPTVQAIEVQGDPPHLVAAFTGDPAEAARILRSLIQSGFAIHGFDCVQEDLEKIFFKLGHQTPS